MSRNHFRVPNAPFLFTTHPSLHRGNILRAAQSSINPSALGRPPRGAAVMKTCAPQLSDHQILGEMKWNRVILRKV